MPDAIVGVDKVIGETIYAKGTVKGYASDFKTVTHTWKDGAMIGVIYSWVNRDDGLYWVIYVNPLDYAAYNATYVLQSSNISLPTLPAILKDIQDQKNAQKEATEKEQKGVLQYYIEKYAPWVIGGVVVAFALPAVVSAVRPRQRAAVSGQNNGSPLLVLLLLGGSVALAVAANTKKKKPADIIIGPLDGGQFLTDEQYFKLYGHYPNDIPETELEPW